MNIGIIGTGRMGTGLAALWAARGHTIMISSRDPARARHVAAAISHDMQGGSLAGAVAFGDVLLLAVPWTAAEALLTSLGSLEGKILIDIMNAFGPDGLPAFGHTTSLAEQVAGWSPGARVVKAFNGIYFQHLGSSQYGDDREAVFFCGDDAGARATVAQLIADAGFDPVDSGPLIAARLVEPMGFLWMQLAFRAGHGPDVGFKLLRR